MRRLRSAVPEPARERVRLALARRLERRVRRSAAIRGAALVMHSVAPVAGDRRFEIDAAFAADRLDALVAYLTRRYALVAAAELPCRARGRVAGEPIPVAVTFDDDLPSHVEYALPVLRRHGAVATAFLCGARAPFWWQRLQAAIDSRSLEPAGLPPVAPELVEHALERRPKAIARLAEAVERLAPADRRRVEWLLAEAAPDGGRVLDAGGASQLGAAGWEIGAHTRSHHLLPPLDDRALRDELERRPTEATGEPSATLAYPHGKAGEREARAARDAGYVAAYTGRAEVFTEHTDPHLIGRLQPAPTTLSRFALQLARALADPEQDLT